MLSNTNSAVYEFDSFRVDAGKRLLWNGGEPQAVTPKVFDTLVCLVKNAGETISKDDLMAAIWPDTVVEENNLNKNISALRQLLGEKPGEHRFIATVPGKGYRFVASVVERSDNGIQNIDVVPSDPVSPILIPSGNKAGETHRVSHWHLRYLLFAALGGRFACSGTLLLEEA
jgi:DNA-binding winged helix-turn-helix (wHTH) protein